MEVNQYEDIDEKTELPVLVLSRWCISYSILGKSSNGTRI